MKKIQKIIHFGVNIGKIYKKFKHFRFHLNPKPPNLLLPAPKNHHCHVQTSHDLLVSQINIINQLIWANKMSQLATIICHILSPYATLIEGAYDRCFGNVCNPWQIESPPWDIKKDIIIPSWDIIRNWLKYHSWGITWNTRPFLMG